MLKRSSPLLRAFARERGGNVAILFGFALIPMLLATGAAVDYGRAALVHQRMGDAADASGLAIGSWIDLTQAEMTTKAQQYFDANYPPSKLGTVGKLNVSFSGDNITVSVSGTVQTTFMRMANIDHIDVGATSTITKKLRNLELVLVLDTTGSMASNGKIGALQTAAKQMMTTLFNGKSTSDTLKVGVVPFAAAVNIGVANLNSGWLDTTAASKISYEDFIKSPPVKVLDLYSPKGLKNRSWAGCVRERSGGSGAPYELTDDPPSSGTPNTLWAPYFAPDEPDTSSSFSNNYLSDGSYTGATCFIGTSDSDKRQCYTGKYTGKNVPSTATGPDFNCPPAPITTLTNDQATVDAAIDALQPKGSTVLPAGLLWGWRVISPTPPFTEGAAYDNDKTVKAVVLLTDGQNDVGGGAADGFDKSFYNAFGFAKNGHLGNTSGSNAEATLDSKTITVCNAIKALGIRLYTIGFQVTSASQTVLLNCATEPDYFYNSPTNAQLAGIFQDIAQGLSELRIAQ